MYLGECSKQGSNNNNVTQKRDWKNAMKNSYNELLQILIDLEAKDMKHVILKFLKIVELYVHFVNIATEVVRTVIDNWEGNLTEATQIIEAFRKSFPEMSDNYEGRAGGTKISYGGIFYKFAVENRIYTSLSNARKALSREFW